MSHALESRPDTSSHLDEDEDNKWESATESTFTTEGDMPP